MVEKHVRRKKRKELCNFILLKAGEQKKFLVMKLTGNEQKLKKKQNKNWRCSPIKGKAKEDLKKKKDHGKANESRGKV